MPSGQGCDLWCEALQDDRGWSPRPQAVCSIRAQEERTLGTKYAKSAQTGDEGVALVRQIATRAGAIFRVFESPDLGVDGTLELLTDEREPSGDLVLVQIKAGSSYIRSSRFYLDADRAHFETWARYGLPVVGIVCDPATGKARWEDISQFLRDHPETITQGPYSLEAPARQPFSVSAFGSLVERFRRSRTPVTRVDATPNLLIREWEVGDSKPTRALLQPIAIDYPGFDGWLATKLADATASKKVVAVGTAIAAFSMWQAKDARNIKLQTFMVGPLYRGTAIGQHLLYHELRTWARNPDIHRVYVTVASSKLDLIEYFTSFGFRVEGFAPNRYERANDAAELVMAKHFLHDVIRSKADLHRLIDTLSRKVWGLDQAVPGRFGVRGDDLAVPALLPALALKLDSSAQTVPARIRLLDTANVEVARYDDTALMAAFYPLRIHLPKKRYVLVPIYKPWADAMLSTSGPDTPLKLRVDNVYYCYPRISDLTQGDLVIFYEPKKGGGSGSAIGAAVVLQVVIDTSKQLYKQFAALGVYKLADIKRHEKNGRAMAIRFGLFEPFSTRIRLDRIRVILKQRTNVQGLTPTSRDGFEQIRLEGLT